MTNTPQVGDRIMLWGTVTAVDNTDVPVRVIFDGGKAGCWLPSSALAQATIEPRPLAVGDRVRRSCASTEQRIELIKGNRAALSHNGDLTGSAFLADLIRIPDQST